METAGQALRRWRKMRGLSLRALGSEIKYSYAYLSEIEIGRKPALPEVIKACDDYLEAGGELLALALEGDVDRRQFVGTLAALSLLRVEIDDIVDLDALERRVDGYATQCVTAPPTEMLERIAGELAAVRDRMTTHGRRRERLTHATARLSILVADELNVLGDPSASHWYTTAMRCADATPDTRLRADVRALAAIAPLYGQEPYTAVALAREAQAISPQRATGALAETIEAFGLALHGDLEGAATALAEAERAYEISPAPAEASIFSFPERRFRFYQSRTLLRTSGPDEGCRAYAAALALYPTTMHGDPAILRLDHASSLARHDPTEACTIAAATLEQIPRERRGKIYVRTAGNVLRAIPRERRGTPAEQQLDELIRVAA